MGGPRRRARFLRSPMTRHRGAGSASGALPSRGSGRRSRAPSRRSRRARPGVRAAAQRLARAFPRTPIVTGAPSANPGAVCERAHQSRSPSPPSRERKRFRRTWVPSIVSELRGGEILRREPSASRHPRVSEPERATCEPTIHGSLTGAADVRPVTAPLRLAHDRIDAAHH